MVVRADRARGLIWVIAALCMLGHFVGLDRVPFGFIGDEASGALHALCVAETGRDAHGTAWPVFTNQFESPFQERVHAGEIPPTYLYAQAAWVKAFGASIASVRALNGVFVAALMLAVAWLTRLLFASPIATAFAALSVAVAPAFFHIVRLATMVPLGPLLLVIAVALAVGQPTYLKTGASGLCFALAAVSYPPIRVQAVALLPLWFYVKSREGVPRTPYLVGAAVFAAVMVPLAVHSLSEEASLRAAYLSVFSEHYARIAGEPHPTILFYSRAVLANFWRHLEPGFLFFHGDANLRHSTGAFGALSWGDGLAFVFAAVWLARGRWRTPSPGGNIAVFALLMSVAFGVLPAALTWEGVPHVLRSIGAYPFFCVLSGAAVAFVARDVRWATWAFSGTAIVFALVFGWVYVTTYPAASYAAWESEYRVIAERSKAANDWSIFKHPADTSGLSTLVLRYYPAAMGGEGCNAR